MCIRDRGGDFLSVAVLGPYGRTMISIKTQVKPRRAWFCPLFGGLVSVELVVLRSCRVTGVLYTYRPHNGLAGSTARARRWRTSRSPLREIPV